MPVATLSAFVGQFRLPPSELGLLWSTYIPWATGSARNAVFLMNVPYEHLLKRDIRNLRQELNVVPFDKDLYVLENVNAGE